MPPRPPYAVRGSRLPHGRRGRSRDDRPAGQLHRARHGHAHPRIVAAAEAAIRDGASFGLPTPWEIELAEELSRRVAAGERWRFANSGYRGGDDGHPRRTGRHGARHGPALRRRTTAAPRRSSIPPRRGIPAGVADDDRRRARRRPAGAAQALERHGDRLACVLFDAMPNRAGLRPADPEFVRALRRRRRRGILLVQDEVLTFRLARGGCDSRYGIQPDLMTLGKIIGGGFPVGAGRAAASGHGLFDPGAEGSVAHGGTFSANPVTMRAGLAALELLTDDGSTRDQRPRRRAARSAAGAGLDGDRPGTRCCACTSRTRRRCGGRSTAPA